VFPFNVPRDDHFECGVRIAECGIEDLSESVYCLVALHSELRIPNSTLPMGDIELAVTRCKTLEALLEQSLGATGKGLHEKVSSVQDRLQPDLVKKLRFIATVRNKIVHESSYQKIDDRARFQKACDEAEATLQAMAAPIKEHGCFRYVAIFIGTAALLARWAS
jgi:hypothetical protein